MSEAICATVILLCSDQDSPGNDAPILVESALQLGPPCPALALGLMVWRYNTEPDHKADEQICALWGIALLIASRDPSDPALHTQARRPPPASHRAAPSGAATTMWAGAKALWA